MDHDQACRRYRALEPEQQAIVVAGLISGLLRLAPAAIEHAFALEEETRPAEPASDADVAPAETAEDARRAADDEDHCSAADADTGYICTSQAGHGGPEHVAWRPAGGKYHRWPAAVEAKVPAAARMDGSVLM